MRHADLAHNVSVLLKNKNNELSSFANTFFNKLALNYQPITKASAISNNFSKLTNENILQTKEIIKKPIKQEIVKKAHNLQLKRSNEFFIELSTAKSEQPQVKKSAAADIAITTTSTALAATSVTLTNTKPALLPSLTTVLRQKGMGPAARLYSNYLLPTTYVPPAQYPLFCSGTLFPNQSNVVTQYGATGNNSQHNNAS